MRVVILFLILLFSCATDEKIGKITIHYNNTRKKTKLYYNEYQNIHYFIEHNCLTARVFEDGDKRYRYITIICDVKSIDVDTVGYYYLSFKRKKQ